MPREYRCPPCPDGVRYYSASHRDLIPPPFDAERVPNCHRHARPLLRVSGDRARLDATVIQDPSRNTAQLSPYAAFTPISKQLPNQSVWPTSRYDNASLEFIMLRLWRWSARQRLSSRTRKALRHIQMIDIRSANPFPFSVPPPPKTPTLVSREAISYYTWAAATCHPQTSNHASEEPRTYPRPR